MTRRSPRIRSSAAPRRGFVMIAVLWVVVIATSMGADLGEASRMDVRVAQNREAMLHVEWRAEGCTNELLSIAARAMRDTARGVGSEVIWRHLDRALVAQVPVGFVQCAWRLRPLGQTLDVNSADPEQVVRAFRALGSRGTGPDSLAAALADWVDADHTSRVAGAESGTYSASDEPGPSDSAVESVDELAAIRGWRQYQFEDVFGADKSAVCVLHASERTLSLLAGVSPELARRIIETRERLGFVPEVQSIAAQTSRESRHHFEANFQQFTRSAVLEPHQWLLETTMALRAGGARFRLKTRVTRAALLSGISPSERLWLAGIE
ncbi:MAG: general secretion pathway protein GspK [Gemmatimonadaceae bacterium]